jgi:hypothetical protein
VLLLSPCRSELPPRMLGLQDLGFIVHGLVLT